MRLLLGGLALFVSTSWAFGQASVPLEIADGGYLYVHVRVADDVEAKLMLDTGAGINTLSDAIFEQLGDRVRDAGTHTGTRHNGERITGSVWTVPSLSLGALRKRDVVVGRFAPPNADGLLSMDFFRDQPFTLDLRAGTLTLEPASHLREIASSAASIPIRLKPNGPFELDFFVQLCVGDSVTAEAEFDTGAGFNMLMLRPDYMRRLGIAPDGNPRGPMEYYVYSTFLPELHYCAAPSVRTSKQFVGFKEGLIYEGLVGHGAFRDRRLTIDIPGRQMLVW
ncbi:MAG TPA: retropepsin-like aspartic protease [Gemmatimonadaceae bacterium]